LVGDDDVAAMAERLEQVEVVVAARPIPLAETRVDVVDLHPAPAHAAVPAGAAVSLERTRTRVTPEVIVDEVLATSIAAPASPPGRQHASAPRAHPIGVRRGLAALDEQAIDLGHGAQLRRR
jgi:hypothetical protein